MVHFMRYDLLNLYGYFWANHRLGCRVWNMWKSKERYSYWKCEKGSSHFLMRSSSHQSQSDFTLGGGYWCSKESPENVRQCIGQLYIRQAACEEIQNRTNGTRFTDALHCTHKWTSTERTPTSTNTPFFRWQQTSDHSTTRTHLCNHLTQVTKIMGFWCLPRSPINLWLLFHAHLLTYGFSFTLFPTMDSQCFF